ncbi:MAG: hypothetical protein ACRCX2_38030 [Paraclostridium sp.]
MVKVFISQPMNDRTYGDIIDERNKAIEIIKEQFKRQSGEVEIIDSYFEDYNPSKGCIPLKYLAKSLELLADADLALFVGDWQKARGCKIEHECAKAYGIDTAYYGSEE